MNVGTHVTYLYGWHEGLVALTDAADLAGNAILRARIHTAFIVRPKTQTVICLLSEGVRHLGEGLMTSPRRSRPTTLQKNQCSRLGSVRLNVHALSYTTDIDHPRSGVQVFGLVCLCVRLSDDNFWKPWRRKFIFTHPLYLEGIRLNFEYEGHRSKRDSPFPQCKTSIGDNAGSIKHRAS